MKLKPLLFAAGLLTSAAVQAERIELTDGGTINGTIISMQNGSYQIQTSSMGIVTVPQSKIRSISSGSAAPPNLQQQMDQAGASAVQSMQSTMVNDPGIMSSILRLQQDPDMQAILQDPEVMRAVQNFDLQTLQNHPKIKKLMNKREIKIITNKVD